MRIAAIVFSPLLALAGGLFFLGLARKVAARVGWRCGPPLVQPVIDIIRLLNQSSVSHGGLFSLGIVFALAGAAAVVLFLPLGGPPPFRESGGLLAILYLMLLAPLGIALSGGAAANPNSSIGVSRSLILTLAYELPFLLILLAVMTRYGTISLVKIVESQAGGGWAIFSLPLLLSGIAYLLILPAILGFRPFEIANAPQEIASGALVEYGGRFLALATIQQALNLFIGPALFVNLFLGGAGNPLFFFAKMLAVFTGVLLVNAAYPRLRLEQAVGYLWRWPTLIALAGLAAVMWW